MNECYLFLDVNVLRGIYTQAEFYNYSSFAASVAQFNLGSMDSYRTLKNEFLFLEFVGIRLKGFQAPAVDHRLLTSALKLNGQAGYSMALQKVILDLLEKYRRVLRTKYLKKEELKEALDQTFSKASSAFIGFYSDFSFWVDSEENYDCLLSSIALEILPGHNFPKTISKEALALEYIYQIGSFLWDGRSNPFSKMVVLILDDFMQKLLTERWSNDKDKEALVSEVLNIIRYKSCRDMVDDQLVHYSVCGAGEEPNQRCLVFTTDDWKVVTLRISIYKNLVQQIIEIHQGKRCLDTRVLKLNSGLVGFVSKCDYSVFGLLAVDSIPPFLDWAEVKNLDSFYRENQEKMAEVYLKSKLCSPAIHS